MNTLPLNIRKLSRKELSDVTPRNQGATSLKIPSGHDCVDYSSSTYKCDAIGYKIFQAVGNKMPIAYVHNKCNLTDLNQQPPNLKLYAIYNHITNDEYEVKHVTIRECASA